MKKQAFKLFILNLCALFLLSGTAMARTQTECNSSIQLALAPEAAIASSSPSTEVELKNGFYLALEEQYEKEALQQPAADETIVVYSLEHLGVTGQPPRYYRVKRIPDVPFTLEDKPVLEDPAEGKTSLNIVLGEGSAELFQKFTGSNLNKAVAIIIGGKVVTAHKIRAEIKGGKIQITRCGDDACQTLYYFLQPAVKK